MEALGYFTVVAFTILFVVSYMFLLSSAFDLLGARDKHKMEIYKIKKEIRKMKGGQSKNEDNRAFH